MSIDREKKSRVCALLCLVMASVSIAEPPGTQPGSPNPAVYNLDEILFSDAFTGDLSHWKAELEKPGTVSTANGILTIDVPRGGTLWLKQELTGPILIQYDARMIQATPAGPNDRVSDLNAFWMATDSRNEKDFFAVAERAGKFNTYNQLKTYYVGQGGNTNSTTRFRRYIGDAVSRPLLPEHDLTAKEFLLTPNIWQTIQLVACNDLIEYYRDGKRIFTYHDPAPYTHGYFGFRTTFNHMEVRNLKIFHLTPVPPTTHPG